MFTVKLLGSQQIALMVKEMANADLLRRIDALSIEKREADEKLVKLQADLDHELVAQQNRAGEMDRLRKEFQVKELVLRQELSQELENKSLEVEKRDFELQVASQGLGLQTGRLKTPRLSLIM